MQIEFKEENHEYYVDGNLFPSVTQILNIVDSYKWVDKKILHQAAKFGTAAHRMTEFYDHGILNMDSVSPALMPYLDAWKKFLHETNFEILDIEYPIASKLGYAGMLDRIGTIDGKLTILDIKTSNIIPKTTALQLAAYSHAWEEMHKSKVRLRLCVHLKPCNYFIKEYRNPTDFLTFMNFLTVYKWSNNNGK